MSNIASAIQSITTEIHRIARTKSEEEKMPSYGADKSDEKIADCKNALLALRSVREQLENLNLP